MVSTKMVVEGKICQAPENLTDGCFSIMVKVARFGNSPDSTALRARKSGTVKRPDNYLRRDPKSRSLIQEHDCFLFSVSSVAH